MPWAEELIGCQTWLWHLSVGNLQVQSEVYARPTTHFLDRRDLPSGEKNLQLLTQLCVCNENEMQSRRPLGLSSSATNRQEVCLKGKTKKSKTPLFDLDGRQSWVDLGGTGAAPGRLTSLVTDQCVQRVKESR